MLAILYTATIDTAHTPTSLEDETDASMDYPALSQPAQPATALCVCYERPLTAAVKLQPERCGALWSTAEETGQVAMPASIPHRTKS